MIVFTLKHMILLQTDMSLAETLCAEGQTSRGLFQPTWTFFIDHTQDRALTQRVNDLK